MKDRPYIFILLAGICWGTVGYFAKLLLDCNLRCTQVGFFRSFTGFLLIFTYFAITDRSILKIDKRGLMYTCTIGVLCQAIFNTLYFHSVKSLGMSIAAVLLYTSPIFTFVASVIFLKEKVTLTKVVSLILCIIGCIITTTGGKVMNIELDVSGILAGIGAGFCFGMIPVLSKPIVDEYNNWTILLYVFGFASLALLFMINPTKLSNLTFGIHEWLIALLFGLIVSVAAFGFYYKGLSLGIEPSKASILSTIELVVAVIISIIAFNEGLDTTKMIGIMLVLSSVILIQAGDKLFQSE